MHPKIHWFCLQTLSRISPCISTSAAVTLARATPYLTWVITEASAVDLLVLLSPSTLPLFLFFTSSSFSTSATVVLWKQKLDHIIPLHKNYTSSLFHSEEELSSYDEFRGLLGSTLLLCLASYRSLQTLLHPCQSVFFQFFKYLGDTLASGLLYQSPSTVEQFSTRYLGNWFPHLLPVFV